jgi:hypothetical protein
MKRTALAAALASLALAPAAAAKGPHAAVESGPEGLRPGQPWVTTISFVEFRARDAAAAHPVVALRSRRGRFTARPRLIDVHAPPDGAGFAEARYRLRMSFPRAGRWTYTVFDGTRANRRFRFPAATIGRGAERVRTGYVAFAEGSRAQRQGGGGPIVTDVPENPPGGGALPPEVVLPPKEEDGGGLALWIPAAGLALAGAAALGWRRRR